MSNLTAAVAVSTDTVLLNDEPSQGESFSLLAVFFSFRFSFPRKAALPLSWSHLTSLGSSCMVPGSWDHVRLLRTMLRPIPSSFLSLVYHRRWDKYEKKSVISLEMKHSKGLHSSQTWYTVGTSSNLLLEMWGNHCRLPKVWSGGRGTR